LVGNRAIPGHDGHEFDPAGPDAFHFIARCAPLAVVYFPEAEEFPGRVPLEAVEAARRSHKSVAWVVFLGPSSVLAFRASPEGVEVCGPAPAGPAKAPPLLGL